MSNIRASNGLMVFIALALSACGGGGSADSTAPNLNPTQTNLAPLITGSLDATAVVGNSYKFTPNASDPDGDSLSFSVSNQPAWMAFSDQTGELTGTPQSGDVGSYGNIIIGVSDGQNSVELPAATILVQANNAPQFNNSPNPVATVGVSYVFVPSIFDPDSASHEFSVANLPIWASFDAPSGSIQGVPSTDDIGSHDNVSISVTDGLSTTTMGPFAILVSSSDSNLPPEISGTPAQAVVAGSAYSFVPNAFDPDGTPLLFGVKNPPRWSSFDNQTGALTGTPGAADQGIYSNIVISATDGVNAVSLDAFDITVLPGNSNNNAPTISGTPGASVIAGMSYEFTPQAADADGDALLFSIQNRPSWASFSASTGTFVGGPQTGEEGTYANIVISVSDGTALTSLPAFSIVVEANQVPTIGGTPLTTVAVGDSYQFIPTANDAEGDTLTFYITNQPSWLSFDSTTGALNGTPTQADKGIYANVKVVVSDGQNISELAPFTIEVTSNTAPIISGKPDDAVRASEQYSFVPTASDADGDSLSFTVANLPSWADFSAATGALTGQPSNSDVGLYGNILITVTDLQASATLPAFAIEVVAAGVPLISGSPEAVVNAGRAYSFQPVSSDPDGDPLTFSIANKPVWASFDVNNGALTGSPVAADIGRYNAISISVSDGVNTATLPQFAIEVIAAGVPIISGTPPSMAEAEELYQFVPTASDPDNDTLTFSIANLPAWLSFDTSSGTLTGTPAFSDEGSYSGIVISVSDGTNSNSLPAFTITVNANRAPQLTGTPDADVRVGASYLFAPQATDADGDTLNFIIQNRPAWATFNSSTGVLSGSPAAADIGTYSGVFIIVSDGDAAGTLGPFVIDVFANSVPVISGGPATNVLVGDAYDFTPNTTDADGDALTYNILNKPSWATFSTTSGRLSGTPTADHIGDYAAIRIRVSDGFDIASLPSFSISVSGTNTAPVISGSPILSIATGVEYSFVPTASDADGDTLSFTIVNRPSWATFSNITGELSGVPSASHVGSHPGITISVSDGIEAATLSAFTITVTSSNNAPLISGSPSTMVTAGSAYSFTPSASDADDDALTFSVVNKPVWAAFNSTTGRLSGTPDSSEVGTYTNIRISVTDGVETATLAAFTIEVAEVVLGSITLNWTPPTQYDNGTALNDLAGYRVHYGTMPGDYTSVEEVNVGGISTYVIENLAPDTYYIALTVLNSTGITSAFSQEVTVVVTGN